MTYASCAYSRKQKSYVVLFVDEILPGKYFQVKHIFTPHCLVLASEIQHKYFAACQMTEV